MYDVTVTTKKGQKIVKKETISEVNEFIAFMQWNNEVGAIEIASWETNKSYICTCEQIDKNYKIRRQNMAYSYNLKTEIVDGVFFEVNKFNKIVFIGR